MREFISKKIAVLIFALSKDEGKNKKPFFKDSLLPELLNSKTKEIVKSTGLDYFHFSEKEQTGSSFGERFANAIADIYSKGYDTVITLGNDSPGLNKRHIIKTIDALNKSHFVLGPSFDGGFYLMGLHKMHFNKENFVNFSWNTNAVRKEIQNYITSFATKIFLLNYLHDLDSFEDIKTIRSTFYNRLTKFLAVISKLIRTQVFEFVYRSEIVFFEIVLGANYNKGSPYLYSF